MGFEEISCDVREASPSFHRIHIDENGANHKLSVAAKVVQTFWRLLFWPTPLSFLRCPLLWEDSF
jgi:hypothetical protein